jgi:hypothetical protein
MKGNKVILMRSTEENLRYTNSAPLSSEKDTAVIGVESDALWFDGFAGQCLTEHLL